jgi:hypothetical protein
VNAQIHRVVERVKIEKGSQAQRYRLFRDAGVEHFHGCFHEGVTSAHWHFIHFLSRWTNKKGGPMKEPPLRKLVDVIRSALGKPPTPRNREHHERAKPRIEEAQGRARCDADVPGCSE